MNNRRPDGRPLAPAARACVALAMAAMVSACTTGGVPSGVIGTALPRDWLASPNFEMRRPTHVILHHTSNASAAPALATLTRRDAAVSAHYLVTRDGGLVQLVDERMRAWHAGESFWAGIADMNSASIGIELDNSGDEPFPEPLLATLLALLADLRERYRIPAANVLGHGDVAPGRKTDPGPLFPWRRLAAAGFGLWCEPSTGPVEPVPAAVTSAFLLQAIGYDLANMPATVLAFRRHFLGSPDIVTSSSELDETERGLAYCLAQQRVR